MTNYEPYIDPEIIDTLLVLGGDGTPGFLHELIDAYLGDYPAKLAALENAFASGNADRLHRVAHALKGSSGSIGARILAEKCEALQTAALAGDLRAAEAVLPGLRHAAAETEKELRAIRFT